MFLSPLPGLSEVSSVCYQIIRHHHILPYSRTHLFQYLALKPHLLNHLWERINKVTIDRTFGYNLQ